MGRQGNHGRLHRSVGAKIATMTLSDTLEHLKALGDDKVRMRNSRNGAGDNQYGVKLGDIRRVAKTLKSNHQLGIELWKTGNIDARFLATLVIEPEALLAAEMDQMVRSVAFVRVADWLNSYVVRNHPAKETLRQAWMTSDHPMAARAGWSLTMERIESSPQGLNIPALLDRVETEMGDVAPEIQWTMNGAQESGYRFPREHRKRALAIGEKLGVFRDYPTSKGCTSPFAPIWINEMVHRQ